MTIVKSGSFTCGPPVEEIAAVASTRAHIRLILPYALRPSTCGSAARISPSTFE